MIKENLITWGFWDFVHTVLNIWDNFLFRHIMIVIKCRTITNWICIHIPVRIGYWNVFRIAAVWIWLLFCIFYFIFQSIPVIFKRFFALKKIIVKLSFIYLIQKRVCSQNITTEHKSWWIRTNLFHCTVTIKFKKKKTNLVASILRYEHNSVKRKQPRRTDLCVLNFQKLKTIFENYNFSLIWKTVFILHYLFSKIKMKLFVKRR